MARDARLMNFHEQRIAVAIVENRLDLLNVAAGFAFLPKFLATAAVKPRVTRFDCFLERFGVHVGEHQNLPTVVRLHNRGNKPVLVEFNFADVNVHKDASFDANIVAKILRGGKKFFKQGKVARVPNNLREVICLLKNFFNAVGTRGEKFLREDGFFFVTLLILNTPIISFAQDFQVGFVKFYLGAFAIFFGALAINFLLQPLPRVKRFIQAVVIILFAVHFVTDIFLLYRFGVLMNQEVVQILPDPRHESPLL